MGRNKEKQGFSQLNNMKNQTMQTKKLWVSFLAIASLLLLVANVSAAELSDDVAVKVNGIDAGYYNGTDYVAWDDDVSVIAGEQVSVKVTFTSLVNDTDVTLSAELEGEKVKNSEMSPSFDVEAGKTYTKTVLVTVPFELKDDISTDLLLNLELDGKEYKTEIDDITVRVQRPSYNPEIKSVTMDQTIRAGSTLSVDLVLKNMGYNSLDDIYVTVSVAELGLEKSSYFGDLVPIETCSDDDCDKEDTVSGRLYLTVPYDAKAGTYTLKVEVKADSDVDMSKSAEFVVSNDFSKTVIVDATSKNVDVNEDAVYSILLVNPTDQVQVYRIVTDDKSGLSTSVSENVVAVSAGSSRNVDVTASSSQAGEYDFTVNVFSGEKLVDTVTFNLKAEKGSSAIDPILVLTIILAIVFIVLLIVLIVLISKKPEKSEEFGESYY